MSLTDEVGSARRGTQGCARVRGRGAVQLAASAVDPCDHKARRSRLRASFLNTGARDARDVQVSLVQEDLGRSFRARPARTRRAVRQTGIVDRLSSELLGFAADARVLIVNCDDFGMHEAVNAGVVEAIENGIASSCSLMVPCPAAAHAMSLLRERPHIPFGIHLALIRDMPGYRWRPAARRADVPSLLDPDTNELYIDTPVQRAALLAEARLSEVERELCAQIDAVVDAGLAPTHLDWHCLADGGRAASFDSAMPPA